MNKREVDFSNREVIWIFFWILIFGSPKRVTMNRSKRAHADDDDDVVEGAGFTQPVNDEGHDDEYVLESTQKRLADALLEKMVLEHRVSELEDENARHIAELSVAEASKSALEKRLDALQTEYDIVETDILEAFHVHDMLRTICTTLPANEKTVAFIHTLVTYDGTYKGRDKLWSAAVDAKAPRVLLKMIAGLRAQ